MPAQNFACDCLVKKIAAADERFSQTKLIVAVGAVEIRVAGRVRGVGLDHRFRSEPGLVVTALRVQPVIDQNELAICLGLVPQQLFPIRARSLERDLLATPAVRSIPGTEIPVQFKLNPPAASTARVPFPPPVRGAMAAALEPRSNAVPPEEEGLHRFSGSELRR